MRSYVMCCRWLPCGQGVGQTVSKGVFQPQPFCDAVKNKHETSLKPSDASDGSTQYDSVTDTCLYLLLWALWLWMGARLFRTGITFFVLCWSMDICWKRLPVKEKDNNYVMEIIVTSGVHCAFLASRKERKTYLVFLRNM